MPRKPFEDAVVAELSKLLRQELAAGLSTVFTDMRQTKLPDAPATGAISVIINNNAGADVQARESQDPFGGRQLEITIDQMVARALVGGRETSGVMRALFGLAPGLIGR